MNSVSRATYTACSPCSTFADVSDTILSVFSYGHVALLDIPCGAGALSASLISLLIELRRAHVLPALPLTITVFGGDHSEPSRLIFESVIAPLIEEAAKVGITFTYKTMHWDATDDRDTARLVDAWFADAVSATDFVVGVLNFSGDLHKSENFERFEPFIRQILGRLHDRQSALVWIEPATDEASKGLMSRITKMLSRAPYLKALFRFSDDAPIRLTNFKAMHPFMDKLIPIGVCLPLFRPYVAAEPSCPST